MSRVYLAEQKVKVQMIDAIVKFSGGFYRRSELESKTLSELKYIYYDCRKPIHESCNDSVLRN
ncbi:MAG: hypothetical protein COA32_11105 [Fluviicola sp.]|nr:MAG: hypothetical protein COA32_11105 [Fluviicola sp.]